MAGEKGEPPSGSRNPDDLAEKLRAALGPITIEDEAAAPKKSYAFWGTQPVAQFDEQPSEAVRSWPVCVSPLSERRLPAERRILAVRGGNNGVHFCTQAADGPIDKPKTAKDVRQEPYGLPQKCAAAVTAASIFLHVMATTVPAKPVCVTAVHPPSQL